MFIGYKQTDRQAKYIFRYISPLEQVYLKRIRQDSLHLPPEKITNKIY